MSNKRVYCRIVRITPQQAYNALKAGVVYVIHAGYPPEKSFLTPCEFAASALSEAINKKGFRQYFLKTSQ